MNPKWEAAFLVAALVCFLAEALSLPRRPPGVQLVALGLALWVFPAVWVAVGAGW